MRNNGQLPNRKVHKDWHLRLKTWFNQAGKKRTRRERRSAKTIAGGCRPIGKLRPAIVPPTQRYNMKLRKGRGFTQTELRAVGLTPLACQQVGISYDPRRRNVSKEGFERNVERLKCYLASLKVFPRGRVLKQGVGGLPADTSRSKLLDCKPVHVDSVVPIQPPKANSKYIQITTRLIDPIEKKRSSFAYLMNARTHAKKVGIWSKAVTDMKAKHK